MSNKMKKKKKISHCPNCEIVKIKYRQFRNIARFVIDYENIHRKGLVKHPMLTLN